MALIFLTWSGSEEEERERREEREGEGERERERERHTHIMTQSNVNIVQYTCTLYTNIISLYTMYTCTCMFPSDHCPWRYVYKLHNHQDNK